MIPFKQAVALWEYPLNEKMKPYTSLIRKAQQAPDRVFIISYWDTGENINKFKACDVGLKRIGTKWYVDGDLFRAALTEKIYAAEHSIFLKGEHPIRYPKCDEVAYPTWLNPP